MNMGIYFLVGLWSLSTQLICPFAYSQTKTPKQNPSQTAVKKPVVTPKQASKPAPAPVIVQTNESVVSADHSPILEKAISDRDPSTFSGAVSI